MIDSISGKIIRSKCNFNDFDLIVLDSVDSTNNYLKRLNTDKNTVVIAEYQNAGRGRQGNSFFSPAGTGIYLSLSFKPLFNYEYLKYATPFTAVVVWKSILDAAGIQTDIKWVNDLYFKDKKICGILTEVVGDITDRIDRVIVGIGVNVYKTADSIPAEIKDKIGFLSELIEYGLRNKICAGIIDGFYNNINSIEEKRFLETYRSHSFLYGKRIYSPSYNITGTVAGISDHCELIVNTPDGNKHSLSSGTIQII